MSNPSTITKVLTLCLLLGTSWAASAEAPDYNRQLAEYLDLGRSANLALRGQAQDLERAHAVLDEARARWRPSIEFSARYSRADGGRTQPLPVGDLVNPAYRSLNELLAAQGQPQPFSDIANQEIRFLREREQDTRIRLSQPLYAPAIDAGRRSAQAGLDASEAALAALERRLERDIELAFLDWLRLQESIRIVEASRDLLLENLRVNRVLHDNGKITLDQVLRAQAEVLAVEQQLLDAGNGADLARSYLNFLLNRSLDASVAAVPPPDPQSHIDAALLRLPAPARDLARGELERYARSQRQELRQADAAVRVADGRIELERASYKPTLAFGLDLGVQGEDYAFGSGRNYAMASVVMNWTLADFGLRRARVSAAQAEREQRALARAEASERIALEVRQAADRLGTALASLSTADARREAAAEAFRIASRKRDAGSIAQVEFIDARSTLTSAELNRNLTRFDALQRLAELRAALALPTTPVL